MYHVTHGPLSHERKWLEVGRLLGKSMPLPSPFLCTLTMDMMPGAEVAILLCDTNTKNEGRVRESGSNHLTPDFLFCEENLRPVGCDPAFGLPLLLN